MRLVLGPKPRFRVQLITSKYLPFCQCQCFCPGVKASLSQDKLLHHLRVTMKPENQGRSNGISDKCKMLQERSIWPVKDQFSMLKTIQESSEFD